MKTEIIKKLEGLSSDKAFVDACSKVESKEEFISLLADHGIKATEEDLKEIAANAGEPAESELSINDLEEIAGGTDMLGWMRRLWKWLLL